MLRPAPMLQLETVVLARDLREVLRGLGRLGAVELTHRPAGPDTAPIGPPDQLDALAGCDGLLARVDELSRTLDLPAEDEPILATPPGLDDAGEVLGRLEGRARELLADRQRLLRRHEELAALDDRKAAFRELDLPLDEFHGSEFLHFVTGTLPAGALDALQEAIGPDVALLPLAEEDGRQPLVALSTRRGGPGLERALQAAGFHTEALPAEPARRTGPPHERDEVDLDLGRVDAEVRALAGEAAPVLASLGSSLRAERQLLAAEEHFWRTESTVQITGWVPAAEAGAVADRLGECTRGRHAIDLADPHDVPEAEVPVLLRPTRLLRPFAALVEAFGLPGYREVEPTLFLAVSYVLMFGMMFGDAGHGGLLALAGVATLLTGRNLGWLLLTAGISSIGFGIVYGSYFGITGLKEYALWQDPLEGDPMDLLLAAVALGVVMNTLGLVLNTVNRFRRGDIVGGLLDKFGAVGLLFYWGALALATKYEALDARGLVPLALVLFLALPVLGITLKGPLETVLQRRAGHPSEPGGLLATVTESAVGAFEAVFAYLANTISFVRLAAYALSHAALLLATFMLASEFQSESSGVTLASLAVIIAGNAVAIVLEGLVASVQALRLEYYEFFGKFFSCTGRPFSPFCLTRQSVPG